MLSGASPFLDESPEETCSNIVHVDFRFTSDYFAGISSDAKDFITALLLQDLR